MELAEEDYRCQLLAELEKQLAQAGEARNAQEQELSEMEKYHQSLAEQAQLSEDLDQQVEKKEARLVELREKLVPRAEEQAACYQVLDDEKRILKEHSSWEETKKTLAALDKTSQKFLSEERQRQEPLAEIAAERARLEQELSSLEDQQAALEGSISRIAELHALLSEKEELISLAEKDLQNRESRQSQLEESLERLSDARAENPRLYEEMKKLEKRIQELEDSDGADCPLCGQPMPKAERNALIKELKTAGKEMGDRYRANKGILEEMEKQVNTLQKEIGELGIAAKNLRALTQEQDRHSLELAQLEAKQTSWEEVGANRLQDIRSQLEQNAFAEQAHERLSAIDQELKHIGYDPAEHDRVRLQVEEGQGVQAKIQELEKARAALAPLEREITDITDAIETTRKELDELIQSQRGSQSILDDLMQHAPDLAKAEKALLDLKEQENILQRQLGAAQQKVNVLESQKERLGQLEGELNTHRERTRLHRQLEEAFGKNGVPALLIEQALPQIELKANEILGRLSGGAMSIQFITQREYKDKKRADLKETLDIQIQDRAGVRDYEMYSGGESFRINFAIRLALSHILAQRAGARLQTLVIDEGFGSQDELGRQRLTEAITLVRDDYKKILVITHIDQLKDTFSTQLLVEKTPTGSVVSLS